MLRRLVHQLVRAGARSRSGAASPGPERGDGAGPASDSGAKASADEDLYRAGLQHAARSDYRSALPMLVQAAERLAGRVDVADAAANVALLAGDLVSAELWYRKALSLDAADPTRWANLGLCLRNAGELDAAGLAIERALALRPDVPESRLTHALILLDRGLFAAAEGVLRELIAQSPEFAEAHAALSHVLLLQGRFEEGWKEYEWRHRLPGASSRPALPIPVWNGEPIQDKTLLVTAEQGLGDQIMLCSCIPDIAARAGRCWLELDERLASLARRSFPTVRVLPYRRAKDSGWLERTGAPDLQIPIGSLPCIVRHSVSEFPLHDGYLRADPERVQAWRERLRPLDSSLRIGISWRGGAPTTRGALRSIPLAEWKPLFEDPRAAWVSLQYGVAEAEQNEVREAIGDRLNFFPDAIADYAETAALVQALDLVITVQTAVAHLAGALGKRVWILLPITPEWRYMAAGDRSLWYPDARLFRQRASGEWSRAMADVSTALQSL